MNEKGTALVEAAIVIPLLLLLLIGLVEMGMLVNTKLVANESARAAAREYIRTEDTAAAKEKAVYLADLKSFKISRNGSLITAEAAVSHQSLLPGIWKLFGKRYKNEMNIAGEATFHLEPK